MFSLKELSANSVMNDAPARGRPRQGRSYNEAGGGSRLPLLWKILFVCVLIVQYFSNIFINADKYLTIHIMYHISKHIRYLF